jgi:uncharacterized protein YjiS (DUF1127 family)
MAIIRIDLPDGRATERGAAPRVGLLARLLTWDARFRDRRVLDTLGTERRADLGLSDADIRAETGKHPWRH